jgi:hypothetical protein
MDSYDSLGIRAAQAELRATMDELKPLGIKEAIARTKDKREKISLLTDQAKTAYDEAVMHFYARLIELPETERQSARQLIAAEEKSVLTPYLHRSCFLALEEKSQARLTSGLSIHALITPANYDYRDLMCEIAPAHIFSHELGLPTAELFDQASTFAAGSSADTFKSFGRRERFPDSAFGWTRVQTPYGERFRQAI